MREEAPIKILKNNYKYNQKSTMSMESFGFHIFNEIDWAVWIQSNSKETEEDTLKIPESAEQKLSYSPFWKQEKRTAQIRSNE